MTHRLKHLGVKRQAISLVQKNAHSATTEFLAGQLAETPAVKSQAKEPKMVNYVELAKEYMNG